MAGIFYATREEVKAAADIAEPAYVNARVDRAIEAASRAVDKLCHRVFYPELRTMTWDWPNQQGARSWRLWLDANELISITTLTSGGTALSASDYLLRPDNGPPYRRVEIDISSTQAFDNDDTHQRAISITGLYGYNDITETAGTLAAAIESTTTTTVDVTDSAAVGVGQLIKVDSERMVVTGKTMLTTGQTLQTAMTADTSNTTCAVSNGAAYTAGEVLLLDSERMLVEDVAGNNLIVQRAYDGSTLAAHTGSTIYARRRLTVERGVLGTTAATHLISAVVRRQVFPGPVRRLAIAEAQSTLAQETAGWARQVGSGDNIREAFARGLKDARDQLKPYVRFRSRAVV
jgi:hypothetical protein